MKQVKTVERLRKLADGKRAVFYRNFGRPIPAIVVLNMPASVVLRQIQFGLYEYVKGKK